MRADNITRSYSLQRPVIFMERCKALEVLHSHVRDKSKLYAQTAVVGYEETAQGVIVTTEDGEQHKGHILIGADGIHSKVRKLMAERISATDESVAREITEGLFTPSLFYSRQCQTKIVRFSTSFYKRV